jgi:hypothetical protein
MQIGGLCSSFFYCHHESFKTTAVKQLTYRRVHRMWYRVRDVTACEGEALWFGEKYQ